MLALGGVPGIYFHSLFGSRNDRIGAEASGIPRRINRQKLSRGELEQALAAPSSLRAQLFLRYKQLLEVRRSQAAFSPSAAQEILSVEERVFAILRGEPEGSRVLCLHNVANESMRLKLDVPRSPPGASWIELLSGTRYRVRDDGMLDIELGPYEVFWARRE